MNKIMISEEKYIPEFNIQAMLNTVVNKYIARADKNSSFVLFEEPIYEKVNDKLWYIYFTAKSPASQWGKRFYQVVMGFACIEEYYFNSNIIDVDANYSLDDLKIKFRNYLNMLLEDSKEVEEPLDEPEYPDYEYDDDYQQMINQHEYEEQLAHELNRDEPDTDYVIASTSEMFQETMVFPANEYGQITQYTDLTCIALRYGHEYWEDAFAAVILLNTDEYKYIHVRTLESDKNIHNLFRRINVLDTVVI